MRTYSKHRPTGFDPAGAFLPEQQDWLVAPVSQTRDSGPLARSNFECFLKELGGESDTVEVHRFGHWGPGWYEIILIDPRDSDRVILAEAMEGALENYPVLDESHYSQLEHDEANEIWRSCYRIRDRIAYIRKYRSQFEFQGLADMIACIRGHYFAGYASDLVNR